MVYGSSNARAAAIRDGTTPFLMMSAGDLLIFNEDSLTNANGFVADPTTLFLAGDIRANEQLGLTVMHTLFVREHNRTARLLAAVNPNASDDEVFEEARRRVIGHIQAITYYEWLPALIGEGALPPPSGYDDTINPTLFNEFSVAAFRLGHSMLNTHLWRLDATGEEIAEGHVALRDAFFTAPHYLQAEEDIDPILRGLATQAHQAIDPMIVSDVRNFLFGEPGAGGFDLASLNIQRGRDHGVPSYTAMRTAMGLPAVSSFAEISANPDIVAALDRTYHSVDDIDLWVGGLAEDPVAGSQLGALFQAILVRQFSDLRDGDRFWYERDLPEPVAAEIRDTRLSDIIRRNTSIGSELQTNVFETP
jgi:peroxidase